MSHSSCEKSTCINTSILDKVLLETLDITADYFFSELLYFVSYFVLISRMMIEIGSISEVSWTFEWKIEAFFSCANELYLSPKFEVSNSDWWLGICPKGGKDDKPSESVSLGVIRYKKEFSMEYECRVGLKTVNNVVRYENRFIYKDVYQWPCISRSKLLEKKSELVPSGILTICIVLNIRSAILDLDSRRNKLADDLKNMFISNDISDATLYVKEKKILAHRTILAARSPVFAAMFRNDTMEKKTGEVKISDSDPETFREFLFYFYTAEIDFTKCNACELYKISDKYDVPELKEMCVDFMTGNLCVDNFCEILLLSHQFKENDLLTHIQSFFYKNFGKIVTSSSWDELLIKNHRLANDLLVAMAPKVNAD